MGLYIRGMEMPETCKICYLSEFDPGFYAYVCKPTGIRIDYDMAKNDRPRTICPLVPVPPHGDLIDRDEMFVEFVIEGQKTTRYKVGERWELNGEEIRRVIQRLPAVIPAEPPKEET